MFRTHSRRRPVRRRGAILLVVLVLLALFAVIGLSFVFYAESQATASRIGREAQAQLLDPPPDSDVAVNEFLKQVLYPIHPFNPTPGDPKIPLAGPAAFNPDVRSALYGHDMARLVYGYRFADPKGNTIPYNGIGLFHEAVAGVPGLTDRAEVINHSQFFRTWLGTPQPMFDPEYTGSRTDPKVAPTGIYVGKNAPYTYPDRNNVAVALVDPNTGQVIIPSYHRPSLFNAAAQPNVNLRLAPPVVNGITDPTLDDWLTPAGRYKILRPRPEDHDPDGPGGPLKTEFPYPTPNADGTYTGDVQNLVYADGVQRKDSVWLDFNGPVYDWRGKRIKPLIAALVVPLDGRINLNAAGNVAAAGGNHNSNMGFGPWEQNPAKILINPADVAALINNRHNATFPAPSPRGSSVNARAFHPDPANAALQTQPQDYARVDWNGAGATAPPFLPGKDPALVAAGRQFGSNPTYAPVSPTVTGYDNSDLNTEQLNHPSLYTPYFRDPFKMSDTGIVGSFPLFDMMRLAGRYSDKASNYSGYTYLGSKFVPEFAAGTPATQYGGPNDPLRLTRALTTAISNSLKRPGLAPNFFGNPDPAQAFVQVPAVGANFPPPPALASRPVLDATMITTTGAGWTGGDTTNAAPADLRNLRALLGAVDLNRPLTDYRDPISKPTSISATTPWPLKGGDPPNNDGVLDPNEATVTFGAFTATAVTGSFQQAWRDRQLLAWDIFARLVIATGASAKVVNADATQPAFAPFPTAINIQVDATATPGTPQYNALRWLAQLAVNIVDYIDNDDISTPFVWNPIPATPINPYDAANFAESSNRVVFGVEKPRVVLNEVYAEVANLQTEAGGTPSPTKFQVRFFPELLNPGSNETNPANPLYQEAAVPSAAPAPGSAVIKVVGTTPYSTYQIQVFQKGDVARAALLNTENVTGAVDPAAGELRIQATLDDVHLPASTAALGLKYEERIEPNNGAFSADPTANARNGFAVLGPELQYPAPASGDQAYNPDTTTANSLGGLLLQKTGDGANASAGAPVNAFQYQDAALAGQATDLDQLKAMQHAVLLRRLACPYLPPGPTNPYITVDYQTYVQAQDAVVKVNNAGTAADNTPPPDTQRFALGRVQPFTGNEGDGNDTPLTAASFGTSLTLKQRNAPGGTPAGQQISLFRHNAQEPTPPATGSDATLLGPFEWLVHLDRRIVSQPELVHVAGVKPHELTHRFALPAGAARPKFHLHDLQHPAFTTAPGTMAEPAGPLNFAAGGGTGNSPLYRALAMLDVSPWGHGLPAGGRVPGKVNINMLWDENTTGSGRSRVFDAIMDKAAVNSPNSFTEQDLTTIWNAIKMSRSPGWTTGNPPIVGNTYDELGPGPTNDRPFKAFGSSLFGAGVNVLYPTDIADTILRNRPTADTDGVTRSLFSRGPDATNPPHPYQEYEPLRKAMNSFTTVSDTYIVIMTVGYFEVRNRPGLTGTYDEANPPILGKEVYDESPGDMRYKYSVVIDRTRLNLELAADGTVVPNPAFPNGGKQSAMWFSKLAVPPRPTSTPGTSYMRFVATGGDATTSTIQVHYEGTVYTVATGSRLRIGTGANAQLVEVTAPGAATVTDADGVTTYPAGFDASTGLATVTFVTPATLLPHVVGEAVSNNVVNGNPGPQQPQFDTSQPLSPYRSVVPRLDRVIASP